MRKLAVIEFVTLDGVMQSLGSPDEDRDGGFEYGGWSAPYGDEVLGKKAAEGLSATTAYLFGRKTYEKMAGDVVGAVNELKTQGDGTIVVLGSGVLVQTLIENDLVDGYRLFVHPLVLGTGKRLFGQVSRPLPMRLVDCEPTTTGVLLLSYEPA